MVIQVNSNFHTLAGKSVVEREDPRYREYRKKWQAWPERFSVGEFPLHLDVEPTNACNLRCPFCATTHNRYQKGFMKEHTWRRILEEAGDHGLYSLKYTFRGEPLLNQDLPRMVAAAKDSGIMDVYFNTNAVLLDEKAIRALIEAGLDRISVSFEGFTQEVYEKYRVGARFNVVVENLARLRQIREEMGSARPLIRVQTVMVPELQGHEEEYVRFWKGRADEVACLDMKNEEGNPDHRGIVHDWACPQLFQRLAITWDGTIIPCVHDIYEWMAFGKVGEVLLKDAWVSSEEVRYRKLHRTGRAHEIPACDRCPLRENEIRKLKGRRAP
jgi:radical SAM protein with 4Fe4S-binding SPASM domain